MALPNPENLSLWFRDAATRHPDILHTEQNKRFFELEWDEMMEAAQPLAAEKWTLVLEEYTEQFVDNLGDYISVLNVVAFMVVKNVTRGEAMEKLNTFEEARRIAKSIVAKLKADELAACDADVPVGVTAPRLVDLSTLRIQRIMPDLFDHAAGVRVIVKVRTDQEATFSRDEVAWAPLV